jgi:2-haloacid dehalogenase
MRGGEGGPSMNRVRSGELPWTKLDVLHRMTLDQLLVQFKIEGLSEDEKKHLIAPLSNGNLSLLTEMARFAELPWDCILSTELVRHYKPDKETCLMPGEFSIWSRPAS